MFEVIGYIAVSLVVVIFLWIQYFILVSHKSFNRGNFIELVIGIIPLLPFIIMFSLIFYYLMEMLYKRFVKWFELNFGWFFINGRKRGAWAEHLRKKYDE
jgi:hypothetical protein